MDAEVIHSLAFALSSLQKCIRGVLGRSNGKQCSKRVRNGANLHRHRSRQCKPTSSCTCKPIRSESKVERGTINYASALSALESALESCGPRALCLCATSMQQEGTATWQWRREHDLVRSGEMGRTGTRNFNVKHFLNTKHKIPRPPGPGWCRCRCRCLAPLVTILVPPHSTRPLRTTAVIHRLRESNLFVSPSRISCISAQRNII